MGRFEVPNRYVSGHKTDLRIDEKQLGCILDVKNQILCQLLPENNRYRIIPEQIHQAIGGLPSDPVILPKWISETDDKDVVIHRLSSGLWK